MLTARSAKALVAPTLRAAPRVARHVRTARPTVSVPAAASSGASTSGRPSWDIRMLYDGDCPLCMREVNFLKGRDAGKGKIDFVDIADPSYDPDQNSGITFEQAMARIHAIKADGRILVDVEVFRELYEAVGLGWVYAATKNEAVLRAANALYSVWAKYRMEVTGREALSVILERRRMMDANKASCRTPARPDGAAACDVVPASGARKQQQ